MTWGWIVAAWGSPGSAGAVHMGALPLAADDQWVGVGGVVLWTVDGGVGAPHLEIGTAIGERGAFSFQGAVTFPEAAAIPALLSGRYLLVNNERTHFAVTLQYVALPISDELFTSHLSPGIALDTGGEVVRFDFATPLWGLSSAGPYVGPERLPFLPLFSTIGLNFVLGDHQRLRIGLPETISWHLRTEHVYVDIGGLPLVVVGGLWAKVGAHF